MGGEHGLHGAGMGHGRDMLATEPQRAREGPGLQARIELEGADGARHRRAEQVCAQLLPPSRKSPGILGCHHDPGQNGRRNEDAYTLSTQNYRLS